MSDIRSIRHVTRHWKDFFVQIAAIAIGLLLALALDRIVGYFHERHQLAQARGDLRLEIERNRHAWERNVAEVQRVQKELEIDLNLIQALRTNSPATGQLDYSENFYAIIDGPWQAVRQNGSLSLMPNEELQTYAWFHQILTSLMDAVHAAEPAIQIAGAIARQAPLDKLTPRDLDELASKTSEAQGRLAVLSMFLRYESDGLDQLSHGAGMLRR
ncbi:MAG TPA: hypothetical protein VGI60_00135 [Chthoniobacterales bacterium]|jgi:hypothetical protein